MKLEGIEGHEILCSHFFQDPTGLEDEKDNYIIVGGNSKKITVYKLKGNTYEYFATMIGHDDSVTCIEEELNLLITGSDDMQIIIWNTREWYSDHHSDKTRIIRPHKVLQGHNDCKCD